MKEFKKYQHVCRLGTDEVEGILDGTVYIQPKIDGTNACVWLKDRNEIAFGSRNKELTLEKDNANFLRTFIGDQRLKAFFAEFPNLTLYGEYLVKHTIKDYRDNAWFKFYVFDVIDDDGRYLPYEEYKPLLDRYEIEYVPVLAKLTNATEEDLVKLLDKNTYLMQDGKGPGEGIVIKRYNWVNKYGRVVWAKIVRQEFRDNHRGKHSPSEIRCPRPVEDQIINKYLTIALIKKEHAKICEQKETGWRTEYTGELLGRVWHALITEETWNFIKDFKSPAVDFKTLRRLCVLKTKHVISIWERC